MLGLSCTAFLAAVFALAGAVIAGFLANALRLYVPGASILYFVFLGLDSAGGLLLGIGALAYACCDCCCISCLPWFSIMFGTLFEAVTAVGFIVATANACDLQAAAGMVMLPPQPGTTAAIAAWRERTMDPEFLSRENLLELTCRAAMPVSTACALLSTLAAIAGLRLICRAGSRSSSTGSSDSSNNNLLGPTRPSRPAVLAMCKIVTCMAIGGWGASCLAILTSDDWRRVIAPAPPPAPPPHPARNFPPPPSPSPPPPLLWKQRVFAPPDGIASPSAWPLPPPMLPHSPPPPTWPAGDGPFRVVGGGPCKVIGACVTSSAFDVSSEQFSSYSYDDAHSIAGYRDFERCSILVEPAVQLETVHFDTEHCCDKLIVTIEPSELTQAEIKRLDEGLGSSGPQIFSSGSSDSPISKEAGTSEAHGGNGSELHEDEGDGRSADDSYFYTQYFADRDEEEMDTDRDFIRRELQNLPTSSAVPNTLSRERADDTFATDSPAAGGASTSAPTSMPSERAFTRSFSGRGSGPDGIRASHLLWTSDGSTKRSGWAVCAAGSRSDLAPVPAPRTPSSEQVGAKPTVFYMRGPAYPWYTLTISFVFPMIGLLAAVFGVLAALAALCQPLPLRGSAASDLAHTLDAPKPPSRCVAGMGRCFALLAGLAALVASLGSVGTIGVCTNETGGRSATSHCLSLYPLYACGSGLCMLLACLSLCLFGALAPPRRAGAQAGLVSRILWEGAHQRRLATTVFTVQSMGMIDALANLIYGATDHPWRSMPFAHVFSALGLLAPAFGFAVCALVLIRVSHGRGRLNRLAEVRLVAIALGGVNTALLLTIAVGYLVISAVGYGAGVVAFVVGCLVHLTAAALAAMLLCQLVSAPRHAAEPAEEAAAARAGIIGDVELDELESTESRRLQKLVQEQDQKMQMMVEQQARLLKLLGAGQHAPPNGGQDGGEQLSAAPDEKEEEETEEQAWVRAQAEARLREEEDEAARQIEAAAEQAIKAAAQSYTAPSRSGACAGFY